MSIQTIKNVLSLAEKAKFTPCFIGIEGVGKTEAHSQWAKESGRELITFRLGQIDDPGEIGGIPHATKGEFSSHVVEYIKLKIFDLDPTKKYILFLDEVNRTKPQILNAVFQLIENPPGLNNIKFNPDQILVSTASNPFTDEFNGIDLSTEKALSDRLTFVKITPNFEEWSSYVINNKLVDPSYIKLLQNRPNYFLRQFEDFNLDFVTPSPRSHVAANRALRESNYNVAVLKDVLPGLIGFELATEVLNNINDFTVKDVITGEQLLNDFDAHKNSIDLDDPGMFGSIIQQIADIFRFENIELNDNSLVNLEKLIYFLPKDLACGLMSKITTEAFFREDNTQTHDDNRKFPCILKLDKMFNDYVEKSGLHDQLIDAIIESAKGR